MMTRRSVLGLLAAASVGLGRANAAPDAEAFRRIPKSVWVWNLSSDGFSALADFAHEWNISRVMLGLRSEALEHLARADEQILSGIERLRGRNIEVMALTGDPSWVTRGGLPRSVSTILQIMSRRKLFDGLDLDVEPHALPAWHGAPAEREKLMLGHLALLETIAAQAPQVQLSAALHPIYAKLSLPDGRNYLRALCHPLRSASLMAYRNRADATIKWSEAAIAVFEQARLPWWSGILVHQSNEPNTSYIGASQLQFMTTMSELDGRLRNLASATHYRGLIFEDYRGLRNILVG